MPDRYRLRALGFPVNQALPLPSQTIQDALSHSAAGTFNRALGLIFSVHKTARVASPNLTRKPTPTGRTRWLSLEEWKRLQKQLLKESPLLEQAARFTLATGLRENNVLELEWSQVDMKRRTAFLHPDQVKNREALGVRLNSDAMAVLEARKGMDKRWVFANEYSGKPLTKASNKAWYQALRKAKLVGFRWHDLRHTWASWHVMNGTRIEELQKLGGWKTLSMVMRYAHLATDHLAEAAERVKPISRR